MKQFEHMKKLIQNSINDKWYINLNKTVYTINNNGYRIILNLNDKSDKFIKVINQEKEYTLFLNAIESMSVVFILDVITGIGWMDTDKPFIDGLTEALRAVNK